MTQQIWAREIFVNEAEQESKPPIFILRLTVTPACPDATRALRQLLKIALRRFGLRCVSVEAQP